MGRGPAGALEGFKSRGNFFHEGPEGELDVRLLGYELVRLDVGAALADKSVEDLLLQFRKANRRRDPPSAIPVPDPVDCLVMDDCHQPRGESRFPRILMPRYKRALTGGETSTHFREHVIDIVIIAQSAADDC